MTNDRPMIIFGVLLLFKSGVIINTKVSGTTHFKVICSECSFGIIHHIIHTFPEYSSSMYQFVADPEAMSVNLGNLNRFLFHKIVCLSLH